MVPGIHWTEKVWKSSAEKELFTYIVESDPPTILSYREKERKKKKEKERAGERGERGEERERKKGERGERREGERGERGREREGRKKRERHTSSVIAVEGSVNCSGFIHDHLHHINLCCLTFQWLNQYIINNQ